MDLGRECTTHGSCRVLGDKQGCFHRPMSLACKTKMSTNIGIRRVVLAVVMGYVPYEALRKFDPQRLPVGWKRIGRTC